MNILVEALWTDHWLGIEMGKMYKMIIVKKNGKIIKVVRTSIGIVSFDRKYFRYIGEEPETL